MLTVDEEHRIIEAAPPYLRVAIVLLVQTGGRKRHYQLGMVDQVREAIERANEKTYKNQNNYYVFTTVESNRRKELHKRL